MRRDKGLNAESSAVRYKVPLSKVSVAEDPRAEILRHLNELALLHAVRSLGVRRLGHGGESHGTRGTHPHEHFSLRVFLESGAVNIEEFVRFRIKGDYEVTEKTRARPRGTKKGAFETRPTNTRPTVSLRLCPFGPAG